MAQIVQYHRATLVVFNGMGGYSINVSGVDFICRETGYPEPLRLAGLICILIDKQLEIMNQKEAPNAKQ